MGGTGGAQRPFHHLQLKDQSTAGALLLRRLSQESVFQCYRACDAYSIYNIWTKEHCRWNEPSGAWKSVLDQDMLPILKVRWVHNDAVAQRKSIARGAYYAVSVGGDQRPIVNQRVKGQHLPPEAPPDLGGGGLRSDLFSNRLDEGSL